jgi:hypothetical protein
MGFSDPVFATPKYNIEPSHNELKPISGVIEA